MPLTPHTACRTLHPSPLTPHPSPLTVLTPSLSPPTTLTTLTTYNPHNLQGEIDEEVEEEEVGDDGLLYSTDDETTPGALNLTSLSSR